MTTPSFTTHFKCRMCGSTHKGLWLAKDACPRSKNGMPRCPHCNRHVAQKPQGWRRKNQSRRRRDE